MEEIWKDIAGYEGYFQISNLGRVKQLATLTIGKDGRKIYLKEKLIKYVNSKKGYPSIVLHVYGRPDKQLSIHKLVAEAFIPNPNNFKYINHKDENKQNCNANNLEWCTQKYNINYGTCKERISYKLGFHILCNETGQIFNSIYHCAKEMNISYSYIQDSIRGLNKKHRKNYGFTFSRIFNEEVN